MGRIAAFVYGVLAYALFFVTFLYMVGFLGNFVVWKSIDSGVEVPLGQAIAINLLLLALFGVPHSVMARPAFKTWWTRFVPKPVERSTYVLVSSVLVILLLWQWRPMTATVWQVDQPVVRAVLLGFFFAGWLLVLYASFLIDHFDLFGLRQVYLYLRGREYTYPHFMERSLYKVIRHPLMAGWLLAFWATPTMTAGHVLFSIGTTVYIFIGIAVEERDLLRFLGDDYRSYHRRTPMILPLPKRKGS